MQAFDKVTIDIDYDRPFFNFPDLDSPMGNPLEYFTLAKQNLINNGFKVEAEELMSFSRNPYKEHFNILARYLDFKPIKNQIISDDDEYIYVKIKKHAYSHDTNIKQLPYLKYNISSINMLNEIISNEDLSIANCYNRNILFYIEAPEIMEYFLNLNKENEIIDIISIDAFNNSALSNKQNIKTFGILLNFIFQENPDIANILLTGKNVFGKSAINSFTNSFSSLLNESKSGHKLKQIDINSLEYNDLIYSLNIIYQVNPSIFEEIKQCTFNFFKKFENNLIGEHGNTIEDQFNYIFLQSSVIHIPKTKTNQLKI